MPKSDTEGRTYSVISGSPESAVFPGAPPGLLFPGDKGAPTGVNFPYRTNFAPRFGFAWQPLHDGKTRVRGGWDLPFTRGPQKLVKGWSLYPILTSRTGFPFTAIDGLGTSNTAPGPSDAGDAGLVNANLTGPILYLNPKTDGLQFFNPASFSNVVTSGYGTAPRNVLRGTGRTNLDLSLAKTTPLYRERVTLELRVDAFNVLKHTEFNNLDNNAQDIGTTFGQVTGAYDPPHPSIGSSHPVLVELNSRARTLSSGSTTFDRELNC